MLERIRLHAGLVRPFRFERMLIVIWAMLLMIAVIGTVVGFVVAAELGAGSPRELYFIYIGGLILLGLALAPYPRVATFALALATIDFSLGLGSFALKAMGLAHSSILPDQYYDPPRFQWHPLLQATPIPSISRTVVHLHVSHSSEGTRGRDYSPEELRKKIVVAAFGGSTTYDVSVSDNETWPSRLESQLGSNQFAVINHGVLGYTSAEHVIQTAFYQTKFGVPPHCALYYVGWNDIRNAHIPNLDPGYAGFHLPSQIDGLGVRRFGASYTSISPLLTIVVRLVSASVDTIRPPQQISGEPQSGRDPEFEAIFARNIRSISAINRSRGIRTIWVGQALNLSKYDNDQIDGWIPLVRNRDVLALLDRVNDLLNSEAIALGDTYIGLPTDLFQPSDFRDNGHFLPSGSLKFAKFIAPKVARECR